MKLPSPRLALAGSVALLFTTTTAASSPPSAGTLALDLSKRDSNGAASPQARGIIAFSSSSDTPSPFLPPRSIAARSIADPLDHGAFSHLHPRQTVSESLFDVLRWSSGGAYYVNISVGTPGQIQTVILDAGSSDLYLDARNASSCARDDNCRGGTFDASASSTTRILVPESVEGSFNTTFGDGSTASGPYISDTVQIGNIAVANVEMGLALKVKSTTGYAIGLMGVGYSLNEASTKFVYANFPEVLVASGVVASRLYSVFLNDISAGSGTILFGGVDTSRYTGDLVTLDILPDTVASSLIYHNRIDIIDQFIVAVTAISTDINGKKTSILSGGAADGTNGALEVLLDTGSAAWSVPPRVFNAIAATIPNLATDGTLPCSVQSNTGTMTVRFAGKKDIVVPIKELIAPIYNATTGRQYRNRNGEGICLFMVSPQEQGRDQFLTLGDAVLRSMYLVYDMDNGQISIAQANLDPNAASSPNTIKPVPAGPNGLQQALGSAAPSSVARPSASVFSHSVSVRFSASTAASTVGAVTGTAAVPADGVVSMSVAAAGGSGTATAAASAATSKGAVGKVVVPRVEVGVVVGLAVGVVGVVLGGVLVL
ncbi:hypothetical protein LTR66_000637 [Elasticomyces elasticus]|nr:hypothetical protein LTR66_000637 [Elasticomyces elasticus]